MGHPILEKNGKKWWRLSPPKNREDAKDFKNYRRALAQGQGAPPYLGALRKLTLRSQTSPLVR